MHNQVFVMQHDTGKLQLTPILPNCKPFRLYPALMPPPALASKKLLRSEGQKQPSFGRTIHGAVALLWTPYAKVYDASSYRPLTPTPLPLCTTALNLPQPLPFSVHSSKTRPQTSFKTPFCHGPPRCRTYACYVRSGYIAPSFSNAPHLGTSVPHPKN